MYTIFFTINCVEQLIFSKTFVDHLQFEQLIFFCLKVKLLESSWSPKINWIRAVDKKKLLLKWCRANEKLCQPVFWANEFRAVDHDPNSCKGFLHTKTIYFSKDGKCQPLNVIFLGHIQTDNIDRVIKITDSNLIWSHFSAYTVIILLSKKRALSQP